MGNIEVLKAVREKTEAEKKQMSERNTLAKKIEEKAKQQEMVDQAAVDPSVKELLVRSIKNAEQEQMSLTQWTRQIMENAKHMNKEQQTQVVELTAKVTARQGIPDSERAVLFGEGQIEAA